MHPQDLMRKDRPARARVRTRDAGNGFLWQALAAAALGLALLLAQAVTALAKPESLAPLAEQISPSVVNITTSTVVEGRTGPRGIVPEGSPFEDFFRDFQDRNRNGEGPRPRRSSALGSGFVISEDGYRGHQQPRDRRRG